MIKSTRTIYFDFLRIFAIFAIVMLHVSGGWFSNVDIGSLNWWVANLLDGVTRFAVPVFVMISGAIFLNREISVRKLYAKYILRMVVAFVFWSVLYAVITDPAANIKGMIVNILYGHYHMWFIYMIVGLYMMVPILRKIVEDQKATQYFLVLAFLFCFLLPQVVDVLNVLPESFALLGEICNTVVTKFKIDLFGGFAIYFVAGYYLNNIEISLKHRRIIYVLGVVGYAMTVVCTYLLCVWHGVANELFYGSFTVNIALFTIAVFVFGKYECGRIDLSERMEKIISKLSKWTFGAYLVHALILSIVWELLPIEVESINAIVGIPVISVGVFGVSMFVSAVLNRIPFLRSYIV